VDGDEDEEIDTAKIVYVGESPAESHELLEAYDPEEAGEREEAQEFLHAELEDGARRAKEVEAATSHSSRTLRRARRDLNVKAQKEPIKDGPWWWALPGTPWPWELDQSDRPEEEPF
jgi:hypothetical protein